MIRNVFCLLAISTLVLFTGLDRVSMGQSVPAETKVYRFRSVDFPGADTSYLYDFNGKTAVGDFNNGTNVDESAFFFKANAYTAISMPSGTVRSTAFGVNASGVTVGVYEDQQSHDHGFAFDGKKVTTIDFPGAVNSSALDINNAGQIVGEYSLGGGTQGFLYENESFTTLDYPGALQTEAGGINSSGEITGFYEDSSDNLHGFLLKNGIYSSVDFPGAASTIANGINDAGSVAGYYYSGGTNHGFVLDGVTFTTVDVAGGTETRLWRIRNNNNVVGTVRDTLGAHHGVIGH